MQNSCAKQNSKAFVCQCFHWQTWLSNTLFARESGQIYQKNCNRSFIWPSPTVFFFKFAIFWNCGTVERRAREAGNVNLSLLTLGMYKKPISNLSFMEEVGMLAVLKAQKVYRNGLDADILPLHQFFPILVTLSNGFQNVYVATMETHQVPIEQVIIKLFLFWIHTKIPLLEINPYPA